MSDDNVSPAARLPGGDQPAAERPLDPQDLPEHLAEPTQMPSTGPQVAQAVVEAVGGTPRADGMVDAAEEVRIDVLAFADTVWLADSRLKNLAHPRYQRVATIEQTTTLPDMDEARQFNRVTLYQTMC